VIVIRVLRVLTRVALFLVLAVTTASADVVRVDVRSRDDFGTHERIIARVHYAVDPKLPVNQPITDLAFAPRNGQGKVEFAGDLLLFLPKRASSARGTVFLEVVNRGRDQSLGLMSDARQRDLAPENWSLGDRFLLEQGFTVAFLGWQFDVAPGEGLSLTVPTAPVNGVVRASAVTVGRSGPGGAIGLAYCAEVPAWAVVGRGRCLPGPLFDAMGSRPTIGTMPWEAEAELVPLALTNWVASPAGVAPTADVSLQPECPMSYELLRSSAM